MSYFPNRIDNKIVKWYSDKSDYGYFHGRIAYLAVVSYDESFEVLFLSSTFNVLMSSECETESEAMDVFDDPTKVKWHKKDEKFNNKFINDLILGFFGIFGLFSFLGEFLWLLPILLLFLFIVLIYTFYPLYGIHTLFYHGLKYMIFIVSSAGILFFLLKQLIFDKQNYRIKEIIKLSLLSFIIVACLLYNGNLFLNVIYDCNNSPVNIELSEPYYYVTHHYRSSVKEYLTGYYNGRRYEFRVNGIPDNISGMINGQKSINVLFYEKSKSVKEITFNN